MIKPKTSHPEAESATIEDLERDQYDRLPGYSFVKGHLRSHAVLLCINPDAVIQQMTLQPEISDMAISKNTHH